MPEPPPVVRQLAFHQLLVAARKTVLIQALQETLASIDPTQLAGELARLAPAGARKRLAAAGIRDEYVFPTPLVLRTSPRLLGYYRLLVGRPQKSFYGSDGYGRFKSMESSGLITTNQAAGLDDLCAALARSSSELILQMSPSPTDQDVREPPLLILGSQFQGLTNNLIGQKAIDEVFSAVADLVRTNLKERTAKRLVVRNAAGRLVKITLSTDPDIRIEEEFGSKLHKKVAIEVKGGADASNAHNRAGEAEKSHQTARNAGFEVFWTLIAMKGVALKKLKTESPTTNFWFDVADVLARSGDSWTDFKRRLAGAVGIKLPKA